MKPVIGLCTDLEDGRGPRATNDKTPFFFLKSAYVERVVEAGGVPLLLTPTDSPEVIERYLALIDGLLITGSGIDIPSEMYGHDRHPNIGRLVPMKSFFEVDLIKAASKAGVPFLGICNGMQAMNVAYGGTLFQDLPSEAGVEHAVPDATQVCHDVSIEAGTRLHLLIGRKVCDVNSSHHQAVRDVGVGLAISARAGDGTVEGIEDPSKKFAIGVQWHPELIPEHANSRGLFEALVQAARDAVAKGDRRHA